MKRYKPYFRNKSATYFHVEPYHPTSFSHLRISNVSGKLGAFFRCLRKKGRGESVVLSQSVPGSVPHDMMRLFAI